MAGQLLEPTWHVEISVTGKTLQAQPSPMLIGCVGTLQFFARDLLHAYDSISTVLIQYTMQKHSGVLISPRFSVKILDKEYISAGCFQLCLGSLCPLRAVMKLCFVLFFSEEVVT